MILSMSMALGHFSVGVTFTVCILFLFGWQNRVEAPFLSLLGGVYAMFPDIWWVSPLPKGVHETVWSTVFFGHYVFDVVIDPSDSKLLSAVLFGVMLGSVAVLTWSMRREVGCDGGLTTEL